MGLPIENLVNLLGLLPKQIRRKNRLLSQNQKIKNKNGWISQIMLSSKIEINHTKTSLKSVNNIFQKYLFF